MSYNRKLKSTNKDYQPKKYATVALQKGQHLEKQISDTAQIEWFCIGFTDGKRDKALDGWYYSSDLKRFE